MLEGSWFFCMCMVRGDILFQALNTIGAVRKKWEGGFLVVQGGEAALFLDTEGGKHLFMPHWHTFFLFSDTVGHLCCFDHVTQTWANRTISINKNVLLEVLPCRALVPWDYALVVPRLLPLPWQGIPLTKWTWKAINMHKYGFIFNKEQSNVIFFLFINTF